MTNENHDPLCYWHTWPKPVPRSELGCYCALIEKVRADEREKIGSDQDVRHLAYTVDEYFSEYGSPERAQACTRALTLLGIDCTQLHFLKEAS